MNLNRVEFFTDHNSTDSVLSIDGRYLSKGIHENKRNLENVIQAISANELIHTCKSKGIRHLVLYFDLFKMSIELLNDNEFCQPHQEDSGKYMSSPLANLTKRELEVMEDLINGFKEKEVAHKLFISEGTVKKHRKNIYQKLGMRSKVGLIAWWHKLKG